MQLGLVLLYQDQKIDQLEDGYKKHHTKIGEIVVKQSVHDTDMAVIKERLDTIIKLLEKKS